MVEVNKTKMRDNSISKYVVCKKENNQNFYVSLNETYRGHTFINYHYKYENNVIYIVDSELYAACFDKNIATKIRKYLSEVIYVN